MFDKDGSGKIDNDEIETAIKTAEEFKSKLLKEKSNNSSNLLFKPNQKSVELDILLAMFNKIKANQFF
jgi:phage-related protein